jgi:hypothetical protein
MATTVNKPVTIIRKPPVLQTGDAPPPPAPGATETTPPISYVKIFRYVNRSTGTHMTINSSMATPAGYEYDTTLGWLSTTQVASTAALYLCKFADTGNPFTSNEAGGHCEGQIRVSLLGYGWGAVIPGVTNGLLRRCVVTANGFRYDSLSDDCEGNPVEGPLAYVH